MSKINLNINVQLDFIATFFKGDQKIRSWHCPFYSDLEKHLEEHALPGRDESDLVKLSIYHFAGDQDIHLLSLKRVKLKSGKYIWKHLSE